jgi:endogenous inhibitor of DNA gyrase (YacG/DUF329 family)
MRVVRKWLWRFMPNARDAALENMIIKCPRCGKAAESTVNPFRPFCSERCKLVDLGNWISDSYRIPGTDAAKNDEGESIVRKDSDKE